MSPAFANRLGELSDATLVTDLNDNLARWEKLIREAQDRLWVMTPQTMGHLSKLAAEKLQKDIKLRSITLEGGKDNKASLPQGKTVERKIVPQVPVIMIISEKEGSIAFPQSDGQVDFASFFGSSPAFMGYVTDLYMFYLGQAKSWV